MIRQNDPAFPFQDNEGDFLSGGLTKREYFAAAALQGLLANPWAMQEYVELDRHALGYADALITALNTSADAAMSERVHTACDDLMALPDVIAKSLAPADASVATDALQEIVDDFATAPMRVERRADKALAWEEEARGFAEVARVALAKAVTP